MNMMTRYRMQKLKAMHELMLNVNDEGYYMTWIYTVPDCPSEYDFEDIASDEEEYKHVEELFKKLIVKAIERNEF